VSKYIPGNQICSPSKLTRWNESYAIQRKTGAYKPKVVKNLELWMSLRTFFYSCLVSEAKDPIARSSIRQRSLPSQLMLNGDIPMTYRRTQSANSESQQDSLFQPLNEAQAQSISGGGPLLFANPFAYIPAQATPSLAGRLGVGG